MNVYGLVVIPTASCYTKKCLRILQRIIINNNINPKQPAKRIKDLQTLVLIFLRASNLTFQSNPFRICKQ